MSVIQTWRMGVAEVESVLFFPDKLNGDNQFGGDFMSLTINEAKRIIRLFRFTKIELLYYADVPLEQTRMYALFMHLKELTSITLDFTPYGKDLDISYYRKEAGIMRMNSIKSYLTCHYHGMDFRDLKHVYCDNFSLLDDWHLIIDLPMNAVIITSKKRNTSRCFNVMYVSDDAVHYGAEYVPFDGVNIASLPAEECESIFNQMVYERFIHQPLPSHDLMRDFVSKTGVAVLNLLYICDDGVYCKYRDRLVRLGNLEDRLSQIILNVTLLSEHRKLIYTRLVESAMYYIAKLNYSSCSVDHILLSDHPRKALVEQLWHLLVLSDDDYHTIIDMKEQKVRKIKLQHFDFMKILNQYQKQHRSCFSTDSYFVKKVKRKLLGIRG